MCTNALNNAQIVQCVMFLSVLNSREILLNCVIKNTMLFSLSSLVFVFGIIAPKRNFAFVQDLQYNQVRSTDKLGTLNVGKENVGRIIFSCLDSAGNLRCSALSSAQ